MQTSPWSGATSQLVLADSSCASQRHVKDLGRGINPQRKPVSHAVGDDELGIAAFVEARPVFVNASAAVIGGEHDLAAVGMSREGEGDSRSAGGVEGVGMVGQ